MWAHLTKVCDLYTPEVECITGGKEKTPYEFGVMVSIVTTLKVGSVVGSLAPAHKI
jgi:IS5 family transposase